MSRGHGRGRGEPDWVHTPDDGRGARRVTVNGKPVERVVFADTRRGIIRAYRHPLTMDKHRKRALTYTRRGKVEVEYLPDPTRPGGVITHPTTIPLLTRHDPSKAIGDDPVDWIEAITGNRLLPWQARIIRSICGRPTRTATEAPPQGDAPQASAGRHPMDADCTPKAHRQGGRST